MPCRAPSRPSPGTRRGRPAVALAALTAVLATLLAVLTGGDARHGTADSAGGTARSAPATGSTPAGSPVPTSNPRADDQCSAACATQAGTRQELHGERTAPPGQLAATTPRCPVVAPPALARSRPAARPVPPYPHHRTQDRGRAPPAPTGT
jgi:hypothetical protein